MNIKEKFSRERGDHMATMAKARALVFAIDHAAFEGSGGWTAVHDAMKALGWTGESERPECRECKAATRLTFGRWHAILTAFGWAVSSHEDGFDHGRSMSRDEAVAEARRRDEDDK